MTGKPRKPVVKYRGAHMRLEAAKGKASSHPCADCKGPAENWAYDGKDPDELMCEVRLKPYSLDQGRYRPLCLPCHRAEERRKTTA